MDKQVLKLYQMTQRARLLSISLMKVKPLLMLFFKTRLCG